MSVVDLGLIHESNYIVINMTKLKGKSLNESDHAYAGYVEIRVYDEQDIHEQISDIQSYGVYRLIMHKSLNDDSTSVLMHDVLQYINVVLIYFTYDL